MRSSVPSKERPDAPRLAEDLSRPDVASLAEDGPVELIVNNNVGVSTEHGLLNLDELTSDRVLHTNLRGPLFFTKGPR